jgi:hypothetical protein
MDTQDKWSNIIFTLKIVLMSIFNGHTGQTHKQHIYSKHFTPVFLIWIHRTNCQTTYLFEVFYPCPFLMDTQDKQTNNILIQSILPRCFYNGHTGQMVKHHICSKDSTHVFLEWTHRTNGQTIYPLKGFYPGLFLMDTQDKRSNNLLIQSVLHMSF